MQNQSKPYTLMYLAARLFAGGYLLYTAWKLRTAIAENPLFIAAVAGFGLIGAWLTIQAGLKICKGEYEGGTPFFLSKAPEEPEESEEQEGETT